MLLVTKFSSFTYGRVRQVYSQHSVAVLLLNLEAVSRMVPCGKLCFFIGL